MAAIVTTNGVSKKTFVPLENNPEVFANLAHHLGVSPTLGFYDIYSLDDSSFLSFIPRPAFALLFICPQNVYHKARDDEDAGLQDYTGFGKKEPVMWFKQTIGHACGLMALLHGVSNGGARRYIQNGSDLDRLLDEALPLEPVARADLLYNSRALEDAHNHAAQRGDTRAPLPQEENYHHYICFVKADDGHLWELNGGMKGPVDRGALAQDEDALSEKALQLGVRTFLKHASTADVEFSIVALAPNIE